MLGRVVGLFGVRGELKVQPSRIGEDAIRSGVDVTLVFPDASARELRLTEARRNKSLFVVAFATIDGADSAQPFVGAELRVPRSTIALAEGEYFDADLIGCHLLQAGRPIGTVAAVRHYPAQDVLELEGGALVPLVAAFVRAIDLSRRAIEVELPAGLVEGEPEIDEA